MLWHIFCCHLYSQLTVCCSVFYHWNLWLIQGSQLFVFQCIIIIIIVFIIMTACWGPAEMDWPRDQNALHNIAETSLLGELKSGEWAQGGPKKRYKETLKSSLKNFRFHPKHWEHWQRTDQSGENWSTRVQFSMRTVKDPLPWWEGRPQGQERHYACILCVTKNPLFRLIFSNICTLEGQTTWL